MHPPNVLYLTLVCLFSSKKLPLEVRFFSCRFSDLLFLIILLKLWDAGTMPLILAMQYINLKVYITNIIAQTFTHLFDYKHGTIDSKAVGGCHSE